MASTALPPAARTRRRLKHEHETHTTHFDVSTTSSSSASSDNDKDITDPSSAEPHDSDSEEKLVGDDVSPSVVADKPQEQEEPVTHELHTIHQLFGDYVRKHEIPRKVLHSSIGVITIFCYTNGVQIDVFPKPLATAFVVIFALDLIRFRSKRFNWAYCQVCGILMRDKEINSYNGVLWYLLGLAFSMYFFPKDIALLSIFLLSWSDTAASTCGRRWGHLTPRLARNKSLAGSIAAFLVGVFCSYLVYGYLIPSYPLTNVEGTIMWTPETSYLNLHVVSLFMGFVAALSEGIDLFSWDDNFTIPVLSSIFGYLVLTVFHK